MPVNLILAICILGVDFLVYAAFRWAYGDRRAAIARKIAEEREALKEEDRRHWPETRARLQQARERMATRRSKVIRAHGSWSVNRAA